MHIHREKGRELVMESVVVTVDTKEIFAMNAKMDILKALTVHVKVILHISQVFALCHVSYSKIERVVYHSLSFHNYHIYAFSLLISQYLCFIDL